MIKTYNIEYQEQEKSITCIGEGWLDIDENEPYNFPSWTFCYEYDSITENLHWDIFEIIR